LSKIETNYKIEDLRLIIDSIFEEIAILDTSYNIIEVNKIFCEKYKVSKEDAIGKKCYKLIHGSNHICKPPECKCPLEDITEQEKLKIENRESEEQLNLILSNIDVSVFVISKNLKILYMNKKAEGNFGKCYIGYSCYEVLMNRDEICEHCTFNKLMNNYNANNRFEKLISNAKKNERKYFEYNSSQIFNFKGEPAIIDIVRDITFRKKAEISLKKSKRKYQEAYKRANFYKDLFTHDINNILQIINSSLELIALNLNGINFKSIIEELVNIAKEQVRRAAKLTFNVGRISEIEDTELYLTAIDVRDVLRTSIQYITNGFQNKRFQIEVLHLERPIYIKANEFLQEVFDNILINAVLHNDHPIIEISIIFSKVRRYGNEYIKIEFIDNARGIPNEIKKDIFLRMEKNGHGMGLGLSLVKKIVEKYNGYISLENKIKGDYSKGSKFIILFEFAEPPNINGLMNGLDLNI
jgi:PAS domain S-box-containing protein